MEIEEFIEKLQTWHTNQRTQLQHLTDNKEAVIVIGELEILPNTDLAIGLRAGVSLALEFLGKLPFSVSCNDDEDNNGA